MFFSGKSLRDAAASCVLLFTSRCEAKFLTSHHAHAQSNILQTKYAQKTND